MENKKLVLAVLVVLVFAGAQLLVAECGDVNNDGAINILDGLAIARSYVGLTTEVFSIYTADVNNDGIVNILDALRIVQYYVGLPVTLNCPVEPSATPVPTAIPGTVKVSRPSGIQCEETYYTSLAEARDHLVSNGIYVYEMRVEYFVVITLCGSPSGTLFIATIAGTDLEKAKAIGWQ